MFENSGDTDSGLFARADVAPAPEVSGKQNQVLSGAVSFNVEVIAPPVVS